MPTRWDEATSILTLPNTLNRNSVCGPHNFKSRPQ
eukprot:SAG31_NODE_4671_length_3046_cov_1.695623_1_plen_34_part_10